MKNNSGVIETDKFILMPSLIEEIKSFLINHLGNTLIEIINIESYIAECKVKSSGGEATVFISLPVKYFDKKKKEIQEKGVTK